MTPPYYIVVMVGQSDFQVVQVTTEGNATTWDGSVIARCTNVSQARTIRDHLNGVI